MKPTVKHYFVCMLALAVSALTGCMNPEIVARKEPQVEFREATHVAPFVGLNHTLTKEDSTKLEQFLQGFGPLSASAVQLSGNGQQEGMGEHLNYVRSRLLAYGIPANLIMVDNRQQTAAHEVTIHIAYAVAIDPEACPDWSRVSQYNFDNIPMSNLGCATATNLGRMVANPADLVRGKGDFTPDATRNAVVIGQYKTNAPAAGFEEAGTGAVSTTTSTSQ